MVNHFRSRAALGLLTAVGLFCQMATVAAGCPFSIRDSAFIGSERRPSYQLLLITDSEEDTLRDSIDAATTAWLSDANVTAEIVSTDSTTARAIQNELADVKFPPEGLTVVLVSPDAGATELGSLAASESTLDAVMELVAAAVDSPVRTQMRDELIDAWCVLLIVHRDDPDAAKLAKAAATRAGERIVGTTTEMDKTVEHPPVVMVLDASDPQEQVLLGSLGLLDDDSATDHVRLAMLTGRGELRGPVLMGDGIQEDAIFGLLEMLGRNCTCTTDDAWHNGPSIPLEWTADMQSAVEDALGFDPEDPEAIGAITGVVAGLESSLGYQEAPMQYQESFVDAGTGVDAAIETSTTIEEEQSDEESPTAVLSGAESPNEQPSELESVTPASAPMVTTNTVSSSTLVGPLLLGGLALLLVVTFVMLRNAAHS